MKYSNTSRRAYCTPSLISRPVARRPLSLPREFKAEERLLHPLMADYRREFADFGPVTYLNCAYHGPFPRVTAERIQHAIAIESNPALLEEKHFFELPERVRGRLAELVGADAAEISLASNATQGVGVVAAGLDFSPGDEVVISGNNFPSNLFTWLHLRRLGVRVHVLKPRDGYLRFEDVAAVVGPRTRVLALDWVSYATGVRLDLVQLGELAHRHGAIFVVDGTQGVGALELDLHKLPVDALVASAYKWLLAPYGSGFLYLTRSVQERLENKFVSWLAVDGSEDFDALPVEEFTLPRISRRFDVLSFLNFYALEASLEFLQRVGVGAISRHCSLLLDRLAAGLRRCGYQLSAAADTERRSTILCFQAKTPEATAALHEQLKAQNISVSLRHGMIRVSPHLYNDEADIDKLLAVAEGR